MSVWSVNKSRHEDHSELALFRELLQKKIIHPSVQSNKRISDTIRPTFLFFAISPVLSRQWVPNMIEATVKSGVTELPKMELQTIICVCTCVG